MAAAEEMLVTSKDGEEEPSIDTDKLSYEIFSILESKFLFGYDDANRLCVPKSPAAASAISDSAAAIKSQRGKVCILSIDGGGGAGMRGIIPGKVLAYLEKALQSKSGNLNARISDYFDLAAGTGVGGFFTAMLFATGDNSRPAFRAEDTYRILMDKGRRFYRKRSSSSSSPALLRCVFPSGCRRVMAEMTRAMEMVMKETFGESLTLRDTVKPVLIPCYDLHSSAPLVFSRADALENESFDFRLWEVCRATWAELGRFEPIDMLSVDRSTHCIGIDGGLAMSNPTATAITHVLHNKQEFPFVRGVEDLMVLSLGCGTAAAASMPETSGGRLEHQTLRRWGAKEWARPIARISSDGAADLVDHAVSLAFGDCRNANYMRIQANGPSAGRCGADVDSDPSSANVKVLLNVAEEMLKQKNVESVLFGGRRISEQTNMEKLDWIAGELVLEHQRRSCRIAPTVAFKQSPKLKTGIFPN